MALVGTCSYGTLIRLGGGDLRALIDFLVIGIFGYMTLRGLSGLGRVLLIEPTNADLSAFGGQGLVALLARLLTTEQAALRPVVIGLVAAGLLAYCFRDTGFRRAWREIAGGLIIGAVIVGGWAITGIAGADDFDPVPLASYSFVTPLGETLVYFMTFTGATIDFGIGAVGGVLAGAAAASLARRDWRLEAFDDGREMLRHPGRLGAHGHGRGDRPGLHHRPGRDRHVHSVAERAPDPGRDLPGRLLRPEIPGRGKPARRLPLRLRALLSGRSSDSDGPAQQVSQNIMDRGPSRAAH